MTDKLTIHDIRHAGYCTLGSKRFATRLGLDGRKLVKEGLPISELEHFDDVNVKRCIAVAKERIANEQR